MHASESGQCVGADRTSRSLTALLLIFLLLIPGIVIFRDFALGSKVLLYKDIGTDSLNDSYPYFVHLSDYIRHNGFPSWSFSVGMGQSLSPFAGYLVWQPVVWLPREAIPYALVFQHLLKTLVVGFLFFKFLRLRNLSLQASLLGSLLLSFSAYMCLGSCWFGLADEVIAYTFVLFALEQAVRNVRWYYIPIAVGLTTLITIFHLYLGVLLGCLYFVFRFVELHGWETHRFSRLVARVFVLCVIGAGLTAFLSLDAADSLIHSPRGSGTTSLVRALLFRPVFELAGSAQYVTVLLRSFSNDLVGTGSNFLGWQNYLEAPANYCGIFCLLILPQAFVRITRRERLLYSLLAVFTIVPTLFPWFRHLFWAFQGDYYRTFSLFSIFVFVGLSMTAFSRYITRGSLNIPLLTLTTAGLLAVLSCPVDRIQRVIDFSLRDLVSVLLLAYASALVIGHLIKRPRAAGWLIIILAIGELSYLDHITVADRQIVNKSEVGESGPKDDSIIFKALRDIRSEDQSFFRITKTWASSLASSGKDHARYVRYDDQNDAMLFGYYGTSSYSSFNNVNYIRFLLAAGAISANPFEEQTRWAKGLQGRPLLSTFACEKYVLTRNAGPWLAMREYDYKIVANYGGTYVLQNGMFVPFGLIYDRYVAESLFDKLPQGAKESCLFDFAVLSDADGKNGYGLIKADDFEVSQAVSAGYSVGQRRRMSLHMTSFRETKIQGTVSVDKKSILLFQMPFDAGWHAYQDNAAVPVLRVDGGLLGVAIDSGDHTISLSFVPRCFRLGAVISLVSLFAFAYLLYAHRAFMPKKSMVSD